MGDKTTKVNWGEIQEKIDKIKSDLDITEEFSREKINEILRERSKNLAKQNKTHLQDEVEKISVLEFYLGQEKYAIKTENLKEIISSNSITEIPCTPAYIYGVINIRGNIISVIDLKKYLQLDYVGINDFTSIIVVAYNDQMVGFVADQIIGIKNISVTNIQKSKPKFKNIKESFISGITNETTIILDINLVLSDDSIQVNETSL